jgi:POT family proton-dependent oligopeptide transporter
MQAHAINFEKSVSYTIAIVFSLLTFQMVGTSTMEGLLVLYFIKHFGMADGTAYSLYAAFSASVSALSLLGGYLGQHYLGQRLAVLLGFALDTLGLLLLLSTTKVWLLLGLCCFAIGSGLIYPNLFYLLGCLYKHGDKGRESGFTIAYTGMNFGALIGFLAAGYLQQYFSYQLAFAAAAIILFMGVILFSWQQKIFPTTNNTTHTPKDYLVGSGILIMMVPILFFLLHYHQLFRFLIIAIGVITAIWLLLQVGLRRKHDPQLAQRLLFFLILAIFATVFWSLYVLQPTAVITFLDRNVARGTFSPSSLMAFNPVYMLILGPILSYLWLWLDKRNKLFPVIAKFSVSLVLIGLALFMLVLGIYFANSSGQTTLLWVALFFLLLSIAEMIIAPAGYAMVGKLIPEQLQSTMLGVWQLVLGVSRALSGQLAQWVITPNGSQQLALTNPLYAKNFWYFGLAAVVCGLVPLVFIKRFGKI